MKIGEIKLKMLNGLGWVGVATILGRLLGVFSTIIVTRYISPEDFGLWAVVGAITTVTNRMSEFSLESSLVQGRRCSKKMMDVAWSYRLLRNFIITVFLSLSAPYLCEIFSVSEATNILRVSSVGMFLTSFRNIGLVRLRRQLRFKEVTITDLIAQFFYVITCVTLAVFYQSVWAIVIAGIVCSLVGSVVSYCFLPHKPQICFDWVIAKPMFGFGIALFCNTILLAIKEQGVIFYMKGAMGVSVEDLGFYNRAGAYSYVLYLQFLVIFWKLVYPMFSRLSLNNFNCLMTVWKRFLLVFLVVGAIAICITFFSASPLVAKILGVKWLPIVPLLYGFACYCAFSLVSAPSEILFQAVNRPFLGTVAHLGGVIVLVLIATPLIERYGIVGAVWSLALGQLVNMLCSTGMGLKILRGSR